MRIPKVHDTALVRRARIGSAAFERMYSFALVRHPYSKVVSHYKYRVKMNYTGLGDEQLSLNEWVLRAYGERDSKFYDDPLMFQPSIDWLTDESGKTILVNRVVRLEDLSSEWEDLSSRIGIEKEALPHLNRTIATCIDDARALLDAQARAIIKFRFARDFATWGYDE